MTIAKYLVATIAVVLFAIAGFAQFDPYIARRKLLLTWLVLTVIGIVGSVVIARRLPRHRGRIFALVGALALGSVTAISRYWEAAQLDNMDRCVATFQIATAARQFFHEQPTRPFAEYDDLIGPTKIVKGLHSVAPANYHELFPLRADLDERTELSVTTKAGHKVIEVYGLMNMVRRWPDGTLDERGPHANRARTYRAWHAAQDRSDGLHVTTPPAGGRFETTWRGGVPVGPFRAYYADGKLWAEATYVRGVPVGRHVVYDRAGKIIYETVFVPWRRSG